MTTPGNQRGKRVVAVTAFVVALAVTTFFSLIPHPPEIFRFDFADKVEHAIAYLVVGGTGVAAFFSAGRGRGRVAGGIVLFCIVFGSLIEFLQQFTGRTPDVFDVVFNGIGALCGSALAIPLSLLFYNRESGKKD